MPTSPPAHVSRRPRRRPGSEEANAINTAIGVLSQTHQVSTERAEENLRQAAARAGVPVVALALFIVHPPEDP